MQEPRGATPWALAKAREARKDVSECTADNAETLRRIRVSLSKEIDESKMVEKLLRYYAGSLLTWAELHSRKVEDVCARYRSPAAIAPPFEGSTSLPSLSV